MHIIKIYKKYSLAIFIFFFLIIIFSIQISNSEDCQNFSDKLKEAKTHFDVFEEVELNYTLREAFITNYNKFSKGEEELVADKIILLMILDSNLWYVFAAKNGCLAFWIDLEPDRFIELIDGGSISKGQGKWNLD